MHFLNIYKYKMFGGVLHEQESELLKTVCDMVLWLKQY